MWSSNVFSTSPLDYAIGMAQISLEMLGFVNAAQQLRYSVNADL
jgi:hypothetical protein